MHLTQFARCSTRWLKCLAVVSASIFCSVPTVPSANAEEQFPRQAFIARDRTQARSGPGDNHYATDELSRGTEVEVHQKAEGGWLAIRPPSTSFSWISQRDIELRADSEVGEVVGSAAVSWIGSNVSDVADHHWLIKLNVGELVSVLGKERRNVISQGKSDLFFKIAPPAGEFRWLHEDDVVYDKAGLSAIKDDKLELAEFRVALRGSPRAVAVTSRDNGAKAGEPSSQEEAQPARRDDFKSRRSDSALGRERSGDVALIPKRDSVSSSSAALKRSPTTQGSPLASADLEESLRKLEAELSLIASQPADTWNFTSLRVKAEGLANRGESTIDRARVQLYLDKLAEFEGLKSRHALMAVKPLAKSASAKDTLTARGPAGSKDDSNAKDPRFDGTGWLLPVHSTKQLSPPYALLDKDGNILQFVSPAPGLNLNRYLRKEIGVFGQKDQATTLDKPHLTAHRIVELDRHRR